MRICQEKKYVFFDGDGTGRVDDDAAPASLGIDGIDGGQNELLLELAQEGKVALRLVRLDGRILRDDARAGARRIEQDTVETADLARKVQSILVAHYRNLDP